MYDWVKLFINNKEKVLKLPTYSRDLELRAAEQTKMYLGCKPTAKAAVKGIAKSAFPIL